MLYIISLTHWPFFIVAGEEGDPSIDDKAVVERPPEPEVRVEPVQNLTNTQEQQEQGYTPPPVSQPSDKCKSSVVCVSCEHVFTATAVQYYLVN